MASISTPIVGDLVGIDQNGELVATVAVRAPAFYIGTRGSETPLTGGGGVVSSTISKQLNLATGANATYALDSYAEFAYTITGVDGLKTTSGTITVAIQINGVSVTGLNALAVTSTPQNVSATAANTVVVGDRVTIVYSSNSSATFVEGTLKATRTS